MGRRTFAVAFAALAIAAVTASLGYAQVVNSQWNTGNGSWNVATNWTPNAIPDNGGGFTYNVQIGNLAPAGVQVTFVPEDGTSDTITSLSITDAADLVTNGSQLVVLGQTTVDGVGSSIRVEQHATPGTVAFNTDNLDLNAGGQIVMRGILDVDVLMEINILSAVQGYGTIVLGDADAVVEEALENSGTIRPTSAIDAPQSLILQTNGVDTIDLDGDTDAGILEVSNAVADVNTDTLTLLVDGPLSDAFSGTLQIGQRDTITFNDDFTMDGADVQMDGGAFAATMNGPAAVTNIANSGITVTGDAVIANDLTFVGTTNTITLNNGSSLTLNGTVTVPDASAISRILLNELIVTGSTTISEAAGDFDWDGGGAATTTVSGSGILTIAVDQVDTVGNDIFDGTLNLNDNGDLSVNNTANQWTADGTINKNNAGTSTISGDRVVVTGSVNVNAGTLDMPAVTTSATANVNATGTLLFGGASVLAGGTLTGTGLLRLEGTSTVTANTTIGVATFDWDGLGSGTLHAINAGVALTINSPNLDTDGDMDDPFTLAGNGSQLVVNGPTQWTANGTITANAAGAGTSTISGTSRMVLAGTMNVDGNTNFSAPLTFGAGSIASIDAGMTLNANNSVIYDGGSITGLGTYDAGSANLVTANTLINSTNFNFISTWTVQDQATLTINVTDYDTAATNAFDGTINLINGDISVTTGDAEFVMDGVLNMNSSVEGQSVAWTGEPLDVGDDAGSLDADLNVLGTRQSQVGSEVDFNSDADVSVSAAATLVLLSTVNFNTVNGVNNAAFGGAGTIAFSGAVNVNEAVSLNMFGGAVDLDGLDNVGEFVNIDAPMTINAATMASFGRVNGGGGVNTLDVNSLAGTGALTVNLDDPNAEWTLNAAGVMNLVNDAGGATLLAGSDVNLDGTVNVTGGVQVSARVDIAGTINVAILSAVTLSGSNLADPNRLIGGTINGPGGFAVASGRGLRGFGTINPPVVYSGTAELLADDGELMLNGAITDVGKIGTADADGVLNVVNAWNTSGADNVVLVGGELKGGTVTVGNANGIRGHGLISARVLNNTRLLADTGTLVVQTAANDNDWDGGANTGLLRAEAAATLEIRDTGAAFTFGGTVSAVDGGRVYANGFGLNFAPGSTINLTAATLQTDESTDINGALNVLAGANSTIEVQVNRFLEFNTGSSTTLNGNLRLLNNNINVEAGAAFSGAGALIVDDASHVVVDNGATVNVLVVNEGNLYPGGLFTVGAVTVKDYSQASTGVLNVDLDGTLPNQFDRLLATGIAQIAGKLDVDLDVGFNPALGATFDILSTAFGASGTFSLVDYNNLPAGKTFRVDYLPSTVRLTVVNRPLFSADFDDDGDVDVTDLGIWKNAFDLNQLGDADGDNDSDGGDFLLWQRQLGSKPTAVAAAAAVPEPSSAVMAVAALAAWCARRRPKV
jgi:hypothetical protein